jgi:hypothetical protein
MVAEELAETAELGLAGVLEAEVECLHGSALVENLKAGVVAENVEDGPIRLPQELEPRGDDGAVSAVPGLLARDGGQENRLGRLASLKILNAGSGLGLDSRLNLVGLLLSGSDLLGG